MYKPDKRFIEGEKVRVGLETAKYKILGKIFLLKDWRLSDLLNQNERGFLVLTNAKAFSVDGKDVLCEKEFLMINKNSIVLAWEEGREKR